MSIAKKKFAQTKPALLTDVQTAHALNRLQEIYQTRIREIPTQASSAIGASQAATEAFVARHKLPPMDWYTYIMLNQGGTTPGRDKAVAVYQKYTVALQKEQTNFQEGQAALKANLTKTYAAYTDKVIFNRAGPDDVPAMLDQFSTDTAKIVAGS